MTESLKRQRAPGLSVDDLNQYHRDGFLMLPSYLDRQTIQELSAAADAYIRAAGPIVRENPRLQVDGSGETTGIRQGYPVVDISPYIRALAADERIIGLFRCLFEGATPTLFEDKLNCKHPRVGSLFPMHQDFSYWRDYSPRLTSAMIYIDEATEENGCLEVVPGWHNRGLLERTEMDVGAAVDHYIPESVLGPCLAVKTPGPPGTVLLFSCMTPHRSAPNRSALPRRALILTYNPASDGDWYEETSGAAGARARAWLGPELHGASSHGTPLA